MDEAYPGREYSGKKQAGGANAFIAKPLSESSLCHVLSSVVGIDRGAVELLKATGAHINCTENGKEAVDCFNAGYEWIRSSQFLTPEQS